MQGALEVMPDFLARQWLAKNFNANVPAKWFMAENSFLEPERKEVNTCYFLDQNVGGRGIGSISRGHGGGPACSLVQEKVWHSGLREPILGARPRKGFGLCPFSIELIPLLPIHIS